METKEFEFKGCAMNGFIALFIELAIVVMCFVSLALVDENAMFAALWLASFPSASVSWNRTRLW